MRPLTTGEKLIFCIQAPRMSAAFQRAPYQSRTQLRELQNKRFLKILRHAYSSVPYYKKKYDAAGVNLSDVRSVDDIHKLPLLEKRELVEHFEELHSEHYRNRTSLHEFVTGGTTGETVRISHCRQSMHATLVSYHRAYAHMMNGTYCPSYRCAYVYTAKYPFESFFGRFPMDFIWTLDDVEVIKKKLLDSTPHLITAYPSTIDRITQALSSRDLKRISKNLRVISTNSEMSSQSSRDEWSRIWDVPVLDTFCSEEISTMMFSQCLNKRYHVNEDCCVLEATDLDGRPVAVGTEGQLIATSLWNFAMPLIRYNQGDRIVLNREVCADCGCGYNFSTVMEFLGRVNDTYLLPSGRRLSSGYLLDIGYSTLVKYRDAIKFWSLVQEQPDRVVLECVFSAQVDSSLKERVATDLRPFFYGECSVEVQAVDSPRKSLKGKRRQIVSTVKGAQRNAVVVNGSIPLDSDTHHLGMIQH